LRHELKIIMVVLAFCSALTLNAQEKLPLKLITTTPMPGFTGDFDHFGVDLKATVYSLRPKFKRRSKCSTYGQDSDSQYQRLRPTADDGLSSRV